METIRVFYSPSPVASDRFRLNGLGCAESMSPGIADRPIGTGDWLLMGFHGPVEVGVGEMRRHGGAGTLCIWPPGARQVYGNPTASYCHSWIHCDGPFVARTLAEARLEANAIYFQIDICEMDHCIRQISEELNAPGGADETIVCNLLENWLRRVGRQARGAMASFEAGESLRAVRRYIEQHFAKPMRLDDLARRAHMSPSHFSHEFRRRFRCSPIEYAFQLRMRAAEYLLRDARLTVAEVGRRVGYSELYYFSRVFRQRLGLSPRAYRLKEAEAAMGRGCSQSQENAGATR